MSNFHKCCFISLALALLFPALPGCHEGLFWRSGHYAPWARNKWAEEEKIADTLFVKKRRMDELVLAAEKQPVDKQTDAAEELASIIRNDSVLLTRLHAVRLLGRLDCQASIEALTEASRDPNADVRIAAVRSWNKLPADTALPQLQEMLGSDTNVDVRLAATKAMAAYPGSRTVAALSVALNDSDPALQVRATESLEKVTGEKLGRNVPAWKEYVKLSQPNKTPSSKTPAQRVADNQDTNSK